MLAQNEMFATRDSLEEAVTYGESLIAAIPAEDGARLAALTAFNVLRNTALREVEKVRQYHTEIATKEEIAKLGRTSVSNLTPAQARGILDEMLVELGIVGLLVKKSRMFPPEVEDTIGHVTVIAAKVIGIELDDLLHRVKNF